MPALPGPSGSATPLGNSRQLSRRAKAAIVVRYLIDQGADIALEDLPEDLQAVLTHQMGSMRLVEKSEVEEVVEEFASELERVGLHFKGGIAGALDALEGRISPHTAKRLRKEAGVRQAGNPWQRVRGMPAEKLKPFFEEETPEICAVILSNLDVKVAAEILGMLPGPRARQITYAFSRTGAATPDAVDRIGLSLASQLEAEPEPAFDQGPVQRVGAILNNSTTATREDVLTGLDEQDSHFAEEVRKAIFTFGNIHIRVAPRDLPGVLRSVDQSQLVVALVGAQKEGLKETVEFILSNISQRLADQMRDEMNELGSVKQSDGEEAMAAVINVIRDMEAKGEIVLLQDEDEPDAK
jgi:flagellar motor switch protein FliG